MIDGFGDLRVDHVRTSGEDSFWPSFTDIMMVIVMIFLITTTFLIVRNWELVRELTATVEAEREAQAAAQVTLAENLTLEERLAALEEALSIAQLRQMQTQDEKSQLQQRFEAMLNELASSNTLLERFKAQLAARSEEIQSVLAQLTALRAELNAARDELAGSQAELTSARATIEVLETSQAEKDRTLIATTARLEQLESTRTELEDEFTSLKTKYDRLIRPARSSQGKHVANVRYQRLGGAPTYDLKESETTDYRRVTETELHRRLQALKEQHADQLYIRIIFPDDAQLTYKDAWGFTNEILNKYDYYHQAGSASQATPE
ncbi:MAG: hypothetical protein ACFCUG_07730 [Thiotrichales bacterium]